MTESRPDTGELVRCHRRTYAAAAEENPPVGFAFQEGNAHCFGIVRVIYRVWALRANIYNLIFPVGTI